MTKTAWVGLVVLICCLVLLGMAPTQRKRPPILGTQYQLVFHSVQGLKVGDPALLGGVQSGRVTGIDFAPRERWRELNKGASDEPVVIVTVALEGGSKITSDSAYKVISTLRGNHYLNIVPGSTGEPLAAGAILNEEMPAEVDDQLSRTLRSFKQLNKSTEQMRQRFADPTFRRDMKDLASNMRFYSREFKTMSASAPQQMANMTRSLERQEEALLAQAQRMDAQVSVVRDRIFRMVPAARSQLRGYTNRIAAGQRQMDDLFVAANRYNQMFAEYAAQITNGPIGKLDAKKLREQAHRLATQLDDMASLAGDLHAIASDEGVKNDLKAMVKKYKQQSQQLKETAQKYDDMLNNYRWLMPDDEEREHQ